MKKRDEKDSVELSDEAVETATEDSPEERAANAREVIALARAGELEVPTGAEDIVEALLTTADERDEQESRALRAAADHQNYQRRAAINEKESATQARVGVVQRVITVMDHFDLALGQDPEKASAGAILGGVKVIQDELFRSLQAFGVSKIEPAPNDEFDPTRHEAVLQQPAEGVESGHVSVLLSVGYAIGDRVVRAAKVGVAPQDGGA